MPYSIKGFGNIKSNSKGFTKIPKRGCLRFREISQIISESILTIRKIIVSREVFENFLQKDRLVQ